MAEIAQAADVKTSIGDQLRVVRISPTEKTWRILIADDNRENLLLLKSLLEEVGFFVLEAKNGQEALAAFQKESPDFIWMDMRMPVMDGYEATREIRELEHKAQSSKPEEEKLKAQSSKLEGKEKEKSEIGMRKSEKNGKDARLNSLAVV